MRSLTWKTKIWPQFTRRFGKYSFTGTFHRLCNFHFFHWLKNLVMFKTGRRVREWGRLRPPHILAPTKFWKPPVPGRVADFIWFVIGNDQGLLLGIMWSNIQYHCMKQNLEWSLDQGLKYFLKLQRSESFFSVTYLWFLGYANCSTLI